MKVKELIEKLKDYNEDADVLCIYKYVSHDIYDVGYGGSDGCNKTNCERVLIDCDYFDYNKFKEQVNG